MEKKKKNKLRKALLILITLLLLYYFPSTIYNRYFNVQLMPITQKAEAEGMNLDLPDGSKVYLEPLSTFIYTKEFPDDRRKTELRGGASVEITEDVRPFKMKIKRCVLISNFGGVKVKKIDSRSYEVLIKKGKFSLEEYNQKGDLENKYSLTTNGKIIIGDYVEVK